MGYCSLFVAGSPEPYDDNGNSPTLLNNNPLTSWDWLAIYLTKTIKIMKKLLFVFILAFVGLKAYPLKNYVTIYFTLNSSGGKAFLSGDIPSDMKQKYTYSDFNDNAPADYPYLWIGSLLNLLSTKGFAVEQMTSGYDNSNYPTFFLLSKSSGSSTSYVPKVQVDDDSEVSEIARYNLQGLPVNENEKGLQIIVYSNYTTKTIIVQ